jgi:hypothetical protein
VAQWLFQIKPTIDISAENEFAFRHACYYGHLQVAQWLVLLNPTKYKIKVSDDDDGNIVYEITKELNIRGMKEVSEWEVCPICCEANADIITECNHSYCETCIRGWLLDTTHSSCPTCRSEIANKQFKTLILK